MTDESNTPRPRRLRKIAAAIPPQTPDQPIPAAPPEPAVEQAPPSNPMSDESSLSDPAAGFAKFWLLPGLLFLVHVPWIAAEFQRLWEREHYQFFPFALLAFGCLFYQRALRGSFRWTWPSSLLILADLVLLAGGIYLNSSLLVYAGALLLVLAVCRWIADAQFERSLGYLILLPLITLRLPVQTDTQVIQWLQRVTSAVASQSLNYFGFLHLRAGNVLEFPGKRFLVEEACSGVQSLFTVLFLAALIACGYRRKLFHTVLLLVSAVCFAGVMNVLRIAVISIAWSNSQWDLSVGWEHDLIGYLALVCAAGLVYSADTTMEFFCSPVPDERGAGLSAVFRNPWTSVWNWLFLVRPRTVSASSETGSADHRPGVSDTDAGAYFEQRRHPRPGDLLRLGHQFGWALGFSESWFWSRQYGPLLLAVPFLACVIGGVFFSTWLWNAPRDSLVTKYEAAATHCLTQDDPEGAGFYVRCLVQLRPLDKQYRYQLAMHLMEQQQTEAAAAHLTILTGADGYTPARLWLVNQAMADDPRIPLTPEQVEHQLRAVVDRDPMHATGNRLLADYYISTAQPRLAEQHLQKAAEIWPELYLPLVRLQKTLKRSPERIATSLQAATVGFQKQLSKDPSNLNVRIQWSECCALQEQWTEAEAILREGMALDQTGELPKALSQLYTAIAIHRLRESPLNATMAGRLLVQALTLDVSNVQAIAQLSPLASAQVSFSPEQLQNAVLFWQDKVAEHPEDVSFRLVFTELLNACARYDDAVQQLESVADEKPAVRPRLAMLYATSGRHAEADRLYDQLLLELQQPQTGEPHTLIAQSELLFQAGRLHDARKLITEHRDEIPETDQGRLDIIHGRVLVALADRMLNSNEPDSSAAALKLLNEAILGKTAAAASALVKIAELSCSADPQATAADDLLSRVLAQGKVSAGIHAFIGTSALAANQFQKARRHLETARRLAPSDPTVLNNLALSLVRSPDPDLQQALSLAEMVLQAIPKNPDALSTRAEILIALERWEEADRDLQTALPHRLDSPDVRRLLIVVNEKLDRPALVLEHRRILTQLEDESE